jgi:hypothetical protein
MMALPLPAAVSEHHPFEKNGSSSRLVPLRGEIRRYGGLWTRAALGT